MKRIIIILAVLFVLVCLGAFISNPSEKKMKSEFSEVILEKLDKKTDEDTKNSPYNEWGNSIVKNLLSKIMDSNSKRLNYFLFSELELTIKDRKKIVALGAFGMVYVYDFDDNIME